MSDGGLYAEFFGRVGDANRAELADLDAPTLLRLLALKDKEDVARFGRDMAIPVGRKKLNVRDAERLLSSLRAHSLETRMYGVSWLTGALRHQLTHALLGAAGWDDACGVGYPTLTEMLEEWPATVLRLTVIGSYRSPELADRLVAAAIVEGTLVAPGWRDAAEEFVEEATDMVDKFLDALGPFDGDESTGDDSTDDDSIDDVNPRDGDDVGEEVPAPVGGDPESNLPAVPAAGGDHGEGGERALPSAAVVGNDRLMTDSDARAPGASAGPPRTGPDGRSAGTSDDAGAALRLLAAAILAARAALAGRQSGPFSRLETLGAPAGAPALAEAVTEQVGAVRALAADAGGDAPEAAFLEGLIALLGLEDQSARMAAGMELLADPVGRDFAPLLMAAGAGSVSLDALDADPKPLGPWAELLDGDPFDEVVAAWGDQARPSGEGPTSGAAGDPGAAGGPGNSPGAHDDADASAGLVDEVAPVTDDGVPVERPGGETRTSDNSKVALDTAGAESVGAEVAGTESFDTEAAALGDGVSGEQDTAASTLEQPDAVGTAGEPGAGIGVTQADRPEEPAPPARTSQPQRDTGAVGAPADMTAPLPATQPATAEEAPTVEATDGEEDADDDTASASVPEVGAPTWANLFAAGHWSLASWLARAGGDTGRAAALEAIAVIDTMRSGTGLASNALFELADTLEPAAIGGDEPVQLLALAAAMRASLIAPFAGAVGPLGYLGTIFAGRCPSLAALAAAARTAAESGLPLAEQVATPVDESARAQAAADAGEWLARPRHTNFDRADRIWAALVGHDGLIGELLRPVAADAASEAVAVRAAIAAISPSRIDSELRHQDDLVRPGGSKRLQGGARNTLQRWCDEAIRLASTWVLAAVAADAAKPGPAAGRHAADLAALRRAIDGQRAGAFAELDSLAGGDDVVMGGAARGARLLLDATLELIDGTPLPGPEMNPELARRVNLLRTRLPLDANGRPVRLTDLTAEVADDVAADWTEAFMRRCSVYDFVGSAEVIVLARVEDPTAAETLEAAQASTIAGARTELSARRERLEAALDAGRRNGIVDETYAAAIGAYLLAADPDRSDLGAVRDELDTAEATLAEAEMAATEAFAARLAEVRAGDPGIAEAVLEAAASLAGQGDLATAEETLIQGLDGAEPVTEHHSDIDFAEFFPAVVTDLAGGIDAEVVKAAAGRARHGASLDFSGLSADAATSTAQALSRWQDLATSTRRTDLRTGLAPALRLLGVGAGGDRPAPNLPRSAERAWVDLTGVDRTGQRLVPAFGSAVGTDQRLLLVWRQPPPRRCCLTWSRTPRTAP